MSSNYLNKYGSFFFLYQFTFIAQKKNYTTLRRDFSKNFYLATFCNVFSE